MHANCLRGSDWDESGRVCFFRLTVLGAQFFLGVRLVPQWHGRKGECRTQKLAVYSPWGRVFH